MLLSGLDSIWVHFPSLLAAKHRSTCCFSAYLYVFSCSWRDMVITFKRNNELSAKILLRAPVWIPLREATPRCHEYYIFIPLLSALDRTYNARQRHRFMMAFSARGSKAFICNRLQKWSLRTSRIALIHALRIGVYADKLGARSPTFLCH